MLNQLLAVAAGKGNVSLFLCPKLQMSNKLATGPFKVFEEKGFHRTTGVKLRIIKPRGLGADRETKATINIRSLLNVAEC